MVGKASRTFPEVEKLTLSSEPTKPHYFWICRGHDASLIVLTLTFELDHSMP